MKLSNTEYQEYVQRLAKPSPLGKNMALAFLIGGAICTLGQLVQNGWMAAGAGKLEAGTLTSVTMIFLSVLLTGLNLYNKLARFGGAGTLVPITGFANAVASPAIDFKSEGLITGMGAKMFIVAGNTAGLFCAPPAPGRRSGSLVCPARHGNGCGRICIL